AAVGAVGEMVPVLAGERALGLAFARDAVLHRIERAAPFVLGLVHRVARVVDVTAHVVVTFTMSTRRSTAAPNRAGSRRRLRARAVRRTGVAELSASAASR